MEGSGQHTMEGSGKIEVTLVTTPMRRTQRLRALREPAGHHVEVEAPGSGGFTAADRVHPNGTSGPRLVETRLIAAAL